MGAATELTGAETSSLLLVDEEGGDLRVEVATGKPGEAIERAHVPAGQGIAGWVVENGEPVMVDDPKSDERFYGGIDEQSGFETKNMLAVPMTSRDRTIGVIEVINKREGAFDERDRQDGARCAGGGCDRQRPAVRAGGRGRDDAHVVPGVRRVSRNPRTSATFHCAGLPVLGI